MFLIDSRIKIDEFINKNMTYQVREIESSQGRLLLRTRFRFRELFFKKVVFDYMLLFAALLKLNFQEGG